MYSQCCFHTHLSIHPPTVAANWRTNAIHIHKLTQRHTRTFMHHTQVHISPLPLTNARMYVHTHTAPKAAHDKLIACIARGKFWGEGYDIRIYTTRKWIACIARVSSEEEDTIHAYTLHATWSRALHEVKGYTLGKSQILKIALLLRTWTRTHSRNIYVERTLHNECT